MRAVYLSEIAKIDTIRSMKEQSLPYENELKRFFSTYPEVCLVYYFGSQVSGNMGPLSDFDFGIWTSESNSVKIIRLKAELLARIGEIVGRDLVDIVMLNTAESPELKYDIICSGKLIFEREPYKVLVEPKIMNEYFDFSSMMKRHGLSQAYE